MKKLLMSVLTRQTLADVGQLAGVFFGMMLASFAPAALYLLAKWLFYR